MEATHQAQSSNNLLSDTQQSVLPPPQPGIRPKTLSESHWDYPQGCAQLNGNKSLSASTLQERVKTPCVQTLQEREKTPFVQSLQEREKTPCVQSLQERENTPCVQSQNVFIADQFFKLPSQELEVVPVGGRLRCFLHEWQKQKTHQSILSLIQDGYKLPFRKHPKLSRFPCISSGYAGSDRQNALLTSIQDLLQKGAIKVVHTKHSLGFYSRLFLVPKPGNRWRPVIDLSSLNKFLAIPKFKMETPVNTCLPQERRMGYIHRSDRRLPTCPYSYPVMKVPQVLPQRRHLPIYSLPFGLATVPLVFTNLVKEVKLIALQQEIRLHQYLDDWLIRAPSKQVCIEQTQKLVKDLGFVVNLKKSELIPFQRFDFLGYHFLMDMALVKPMQDRWTKLQEMFHCLSLKSVISARTLMSTIGLLASMEKTVKVGRIHMRSFQWHLKTHWKYLMPLDTPIPWNRKMIRHGKWWLDPQNMLQGEFLLPREHKILIFTDASNAEWSTQLNQESTGGLWSQHKKHLHINLLELKAVFLALQFFKKNCSNNLVLIASDNTSVVSYINKQGGTKSAALCALIWRILIWCHNNKVTLRARHVPGSLNIIADGLSRRNQIQSTE